MKVFISWSGDDSRRISDILAKWLRMVLQVVDPYVSTSIEKGQRWAADLAAALENSSVGVVVLTPGNTVSPWIHFESGALTKTVEQSRLLTLLCGLDPSDVRDPLAQFQATRFNKEDVFQMLRSLNSAAGERALPDAVLGETYEALWPLLQREVEPILDAMATNPPRAEPASSEGKINSILEELLLLSRQQSQLLSSPERLFPKELVAKSLLNTPSNALASLDLVKAALEVLLKKWEVVEAQIQKLRDSGEEPDDLEPLIKDLGTVIKKLSETNWVEVAELVKPLTGWLSAGEWDHSLRKPYWFRLHDRYKDKGD
jgi:hypothetical protein